MKAIWQCGVKGCPKWAAENSEFCGDHKPMLVFGTKPEMTQDALVERVNTLEKRIADLEYRLRSDDGGWGW
jgi:hypothetical protein